ncbi:hypothetical protein EYF80_017198 [Liparis tanakae]|uniref:Uncharacterized protein n=1 Tax=Liparis tanakae TaxID=230148 RepID=A0A4Z2I4A0_9TELE|nr:hypothetical protein EYF80_017198 [Liparis tanakae]
MGSHVSGKRLGGLVAVGERGYDTVRSMDMEEEEEHGRGNEERPPNVLERKRERKSRILTLNQLPSKIMFRQLSTEQLVLAPALSGALAGRRYSSRLGKGSETFCKWVQSLQLFLGVVCYALPRLITAPADLPVVGQDSVVVGAVITIYTLSLEEIHTNVHRVRLVCVILELREQLKDQVQGGLFTFVLK